MRRLLTFIALGLIAALLQGTILRMMLPPILIPNIVIILVSLLGCYLPNPQGALIAFVLGLQYDIFCSRTLIGPYAAASVVVFGITASVSTRLYLESAMTIIFAVFLSSLINDLISVVVASQFQQVESLIYELLKYAVVSAVTTSILAPFVFELVKSRILKIKSRGDSRELGWTH